MKDDTAPEIPTNGLYNPLTDERRAEGVTELMLASGMGDVRAVLFLLARGDDIAARDRDGWTALHHATLAGEHQTIMALLIAAGSDVNAKTGIGSCALIMSAGRGKVEEVRTLIRLGADVYMTDAGGRTALMAAEIGGHSDEEQDAVIQMLVLAGRRTKES